MVNSKISSEFLKKWQILLDLKKIGGQASSYDTLQNMIKSYNKNITSECVLKQKGRIR